MSALAPRHAFTVDEYHRMIESGIFTEDDRVELIEGEVVEMAAIGSRHAACVNRLTRLLVQGAGERAVVTIQNPIQLGDRSEPEPDVVLARPREDFYAESHPTAEDVLLLVEVSDSFHRYDDTVKLPLYARHGVREVWRIDLEAGTVTVHREADGERYGSVSIARPGDRVAPEAMPDLRVQVSAVFGS